jgi:hypothetical protein
MSKAQLVITGVVLEGRSSVRWETPSKGTGSGEPVRL